LVRTVVHKLVREDVERRCEEHDRAVGVLARASAADLARPALESSEVVRARAPLRDARGCVGEAPQAEEAWSALRRAFRGEIAHDPGRLADGASGGRKHADHAATEPEILVDRRLPGGLPLHPGPEVTT